MKRKRSRSETGSTGHGTPGAQFEVFLSFRGPDTRTNFTDSLYHALLDKGIHVFMDKKGIDVGEEIGPEIFQAINDSKICIPIFSKEYASSSWCLRELEHMMECRKTEELEVLPIFYDVEPSDVKLETGVYRDALTQHKGKRGAEIVLRWEEALKEVAGIKGWDTKNKGHGKLTRLVAHQVLLKLKASPIHLSDPLVGMHQSVDEVINLLRVESKDIRLVGICGIGGIGKTTLAKVIYHKLSAEFESCSFIPDIRQASESSSSGLLNLQRQLVHDILGDKRIEISNIDRGKNMIKARFCRKRVLIFLDDVNEKSQLMALAEKREWFGLGSRIVVTTKDKSVLSVFEDSLTYEVSELSSLDSLQLFSKHAFRRNSPPSEFLYLSENVIAKAGGLPLTIELIGSFLCGKERAVWEDTIKKMEKHLHKDVEKKLMLSYEALDETQKQIFLDIACFLAGENKRDATYMWDDCELFPNEGIEVLLLMCLVKIGAKNELWMHDQLKDLGMCIVRSQNRNDPGKRSHVWNHKEALDMITRNKGTETIEAICVDLDGAFLTPEEFKTVPNIRFLGMISGNLSGDFEGLFLEVRWLSWKNYPLNLQATNFHLKNLLIIDLSATEITESWNGWTQLKVATRLKVLNLSNCHRLRITPDLSTYLSLEILILEDCRNLIRIHRSIGHLKHLKHLNLRRCYRLQMLPVELGSLEALTELLMDQNISLIGYDTISKIPSSIGALVNLECLAIRGAPNLTTLPDSIGMLKSLAELDVSRTGIVELPNSIVNLKRMKVLKMNGSRIQKLPEAIGMLEKLEEIYGECCTRLEMISGDIVRLSFLKILKLTQTRVQNVPKLPQSLVSLCLSSTATKEAPEISNLVSLRNLELCFTSSTSIKYFPKVQTYSPCCMLELPRITSIRSYLGCLCYLKELVLHNCKNLRQIGQLPSSLRKLTVQNCILLEVVDLSNLENLLELSLQDRVSDIQGLEHLTLLQCLRVFYCKSTKFSGLERLENLQLLWISHCPFLQRLPDLSNFKILKDFLLWSCPKLVDIQDLDSLESLESLEIGNCSSLRSLPDLSNLKKLKTYWW
ncbi:hypothetical protein ACJRO7_014626 [Eucalyptus globulus]|uniref:TIR domain-containing protein n=1 Tax=Eucalyptus globulus TaxID=34317 RepID=A0ABD3L6N6_EUCGL